MHIEHFKIIKVSGGNMFSYFKRAFYKRNDKALRIDGKHCYLRTFTERDAFELASLLSRNKYFWSQFEPLHREEFYTVEAQHKKIIESLQMLAMRREYSLGIFDYRTNTLIGHISLYAIKRVPYSSAFIGYSMDQSYTGRGIASEAVQLMLQLAFQTLQLHRVEAYIAPDNIASIRVIEKNGFQREGLLRKLLYINGYWVDHYLYAILEEDFSKHREQGNV